MCNFNKNSRNKVFLGAETAILLNDILKSEGDKRNLLTCDSVISNYLESIGEEDTSFFGNDIKIIWEELRHTYFEDNSTDDEKIKLIIFEDTKEKLSIIRRKMECQIREMLIEGMTYEERMNNEELYEKELLLSDYGFDFVVRKLLLTCYGKVELKSPIPFRQYTDSVFDFNVERASKRGYYTNLFEEIDL